MGQDARQRPFHADCVLVGLSKGPETRRRVKSGNRMGGRRGSLSYNNIPRRFPKAEHGPVSPPSAPGQPLTAPGPVHSADTMALPQPGEHGVHMWMARIGSGAHCRSGRRSLSPAAVWSARTPGLRRGRCQPARCHLQLHSAVSSCLAPQSEPDRGSATGLVPSECRAEPPRIFSPADPGCSCCSLISGGGPGGGGEGTAANEGRGRGRAQDKRWRGWGLAAIPLEPGPGGKEFQAAAEDWELSSPSGRRGRRDLKGGSGRLSCRKACPSAAAAEQRREERTLEPEFPTR